MSTVSKAFEILSMFSKYKSEITLAEVVKVSGFSKTSAHRLLNSLVAEKSLTKSSRPARYSLGPKLFELGSLFTLHLEFPRVVLPYLVEVSKKAHGTAYLAVVDGYEALYLERVEWKHNYQGHLVLKGGRLPLTEGAGPLMLLAGMSDERIAEVVAAKGFTQHTEYSLMDLEQLMIVVSEIRHRGCAVRYDVLSRFGGSVAVPIFNKQKIVAAISVAGINREYTDEKILNKKIAILRENATLVSRDLGYS